MLEDIAILTGGKVVAPGRSQARPGWSRRPGSCSSDCVTKDNTTIVDGAGDSSEVKARVAQLQAEIARTDSDWDREKLQSGWPSSPASLCDQGRRSH